MAIQFNNPGNLIYAGQEGAVQGQRRNDGTHWAEFPDLTSGITALQKQIELDKSRNLTLKDWVQKFSPTEDNNNTNYLLDYYSKSLRKNPEDTIADVDTSLFAKAITKIETGEDLPENGDLTKLDLSKFEGEQVEGGIDLSQFEQEGKLQQDNALRKRLLDNGFTNEEIDAHFGITHPESPGWMQAVTEAMNNLNNWGVETVETGAGVVAGAAGWMVSNLTGAANGMFHLAATGNVEESAKVAKEVKHDMEVLFGQVTDLGVTHPSARRNLEAIGQVIEVFTSGVDRTVDAVTEPTVRVMGHKVRNPLAEFFPHENSPLGKTLSYKALAPWIKYLGKFGIEFMMFKWGHNTVKGLHDITIPVKGRTIPTTRTRADGTIEEVTVQVPSPKEISDIAVNEILNNRTPEQYLAKTPDPYHNMPFQEFKQYLSTDLWEEADLVLLHDRFINMTEAGLTDTLEWRIVRDLMLESSHKQSMLDRLSQEMVDRAHARLPIQNRIRKITGELSGEKAEKAAKVFDSVEADIENIRILANNIKKEFADLELGRRKGLQQEPRTAEGQVPRTPSEKLSDAVLDMVDRQREAEKITNLDLDHFFRGVYNSMLKDVPQEAKIIIESALGTGRKPIGKSFADRVNEEVQVRRSAVEQQAKKVETSRKAAEEKGIDAQELERRRLDVEDQQVQLKFMRTEMEAYDAELKAQVEGRVIEEVGKVSMEKPETADFTVLDEAIDSLVKTSKSLYSPEEVTRIAEMAEALKKMDIAKLNDLVQGLRGENPRIISRETYERAKAAVDADLASGKLRMGIDPELVKNAIIVGAYHLETGFRKFGEWSKLMTQQFGEVIKPELKRIWEESQRYYHENLLNTVANNLKAKSIDESIGTEKQRKFLDTAANSNSADPNLQAKVKAVDPQTYIIKTTKQAEANAKAIVDQSRDMAEQILLDETTAWTSDKAAIGLELADRLQREGFTLKEAGNESAANVLYDKATAIIESIDRQAREAGRGNQYLSVWSKLTPEGWLRWAENQVKKIREERPLISKMVDKMTGKKFHFWMDEKTCKGLVPLIKFQDGVESVECKSGIESWHMGGQPYHFDLPTEAYDGKEIYHLGMRQFPARQITHQTRCWLEGAVRQIEREQRKQAKAYILVAKKAVANKLARACYYMLKRDEVFDVTRAFS